MYTRLGDVDSKMIATSWAAWRTVERLFSEFLVQHKVWLARRFSDPHSCVVHWLRAMRLLSMWWLLWSTI